MTGLSERLTLPKPPSHTAGKWPRQDSHWPNSSQSPWPQLSGPGFVIRGSWKALNLSGPQSPIYKWGDWTRFLPAQTAKVATQNYVIKRMSKSWNVKIIPLHLARSICWDRRVNVYSLGENINNQGGNKMTFVVTWWGPENSINWAPSSPKPSG